MLQIDTYEWLYCGCFIQMNEHPRLYGKYEVFQDNEKQTHIGRTMTKKEAMQLAKKHKCTDNYSEYK